MSPLFPVILFAVLVLLFLVVIKRFKRVPPNKLMVVFGRVGRKTPSKVYHGGFQFIWPFIQDAKFLDKRPITIDIQLVGALSKENIRVSLPSRFTFAIGDSPELMNAAAVNLLDLTIDKIEEQARDIIFGQLRATIATMRIEDINGNREEFEAQVMNNIESELNKLGLKLINVNIVDIKDESGYIEALGQRAAAEATNKARREVAEQERTGAVGVADNRKQQRIAVAQAEAEAKAGENLSAKQVAESDALLEVARVEAERSVEAARRIAEQRIQQETYQAEREAQMARAESVREERRAEVIVPAEVAKQQTEIQAEAEKIKHVKAGEAHGLAQRARQQGEAEGLLLTREAEAAGTRKQLEAEAAGQRAILEAKAAGQEASLLNQSAGFKQLLEVVGNDFQKAQTLLLIEKLPELARIQAEALQHLPLERITLYGGQGGTQQSVSDLMQQFTNLLPVLHQYAKEHDLKLPTLFGQAEEGNAGTPPRNPAAE